MKRDEVIHWLSEMMNQCVHGNKYDDPHRGDKVQALAIAKAVLADDSKDAVYKKGVRAGWNKCVNAYKDGWPVDYIK